MTWLTHLLGLDNANGTPYLAWSGFGGDVSEFAIVGGLIAHYKARTCHVDRCWRPGSHPVAGTPYWACKRHHPAVPDRITAAHIADAHEQAERGTTS